MFVCPHDAVPLCAQMSDLDERFVLRISAGEMQELRVLATKEHRSLSAMVRLLIKEATTEKEAP